MDQPTALDIWSSKFCLGSTSTCLKKSSKLPGVSFGVAHVNSMEFVSSLIAVVGLADQVISCCRRYVSGVKDCPSDLRLILVETSCLKSVLENLEFLYENSPDPELRGFYIRLDSPNGLIQACRECLGKLDELLPDDNIQGATGKRKRATVTLQRLAWPLRETRARKLLGELGSLRASISLALATGSACVNPHPSIDAYPVISLCRRFKMLIHSLAAKSRTPTQKSSICVTNSIVCIHFRTDPFA